MHNKRNGSQSNQEDDYKRLLTEIDCLKTEEEIKLQKIKKYLENLEKKHFDQNSELLLRLFIHEVSNIKNLEYDLNKLITVN